MNLFGPFGIDIDPEEMPFFRPTKWLLHFGDLKDTLDYALMVPEKYRDLMDMMDVYVFGKTHNRRIKTFSEFTYLEFTDFDEAVLHFLEVLKVARES